MRSWRAYMQAAEIRSAYDLWLPGDDRPPMPNPEPEPEPEPEPQPFPEPDVMRYVDLPLYLEYEGRQVEDMRLRGSLPYNVDGVVSAWLGERRCASCPAHLQTPWVAR